MLTLYGFDVSNYYNMIKFVLDVKGIDYQTVTTYPNQTPEYLAISPMGKVPVLQTSEGVLAETSVIIDYLEEQYPDTPLYPDNTFEKARCKELVKIIELYIELPARRCHTEAFWNVPVHEQTKKEVKRALLNGVQALDRTASFSPFVAGNSMTVADVFFLYTMDLASAVASKLYDINLYDHIQGGQALMEQLKTLPEVHKIETDRKAAVPAFNAYLQKAFSGQ